MIALDASALLAIVLFEPESLDFARMVVQHDCVVATPTLLEAYMKLDRARASKQIMALDFLISRSTVETVAFDADHLRIARSACEQYGRGRGHPAQLNFGDCISYAVAKKRGIPLLFKGNDFIHTDIKPALPT